jgi:hypothetical protein
MTTTPRTGVLGVNLGKNKTSEDEVGVSVLEMLCLLPNHHSIYLLE